MVVVHHRKLCGALPVDRHMSCAHPACYRNVFVGENRGCGGNVGIWPKGFNLAAYQYVMEDAQFWKSLSVTLMRVAIGVPINIILVILTAYPLSKSNNRFHGRTFFSWFFVFTMLFNGGMIPGYIVISKLGLINSIWR